MLPLPHQVFDQPIEKNHLVRMNPLTGFD